MSSTPLKLKPIEEVVAIVIDYGTFTSLAEKLAETMKKVYYYSPYEEEYQDIRECMKGTGLSKVERIDEFFDPKVFDTIDLFVFPDIGYGGLQRHLRSLGKAVWGSMGANEMELRRDYFLDILKEVGLPVIGYKKIVGLTNLTNHLKTVRDKWIKINRFRRNMETWHHLDYNHSVRMLESLAISFGGAREQTVFIVQDQIESDIEAGYDGWCVDGQFPSHSFQGYEKKNELYLGSLLPNDQIADEVKSINEKMAPVLKKYGYRNWWATEIRVKDGVPYFIDPTPRMPGQTGEHQLETCTNLAEVIWHGANGDLIEPEFGWKYAAEATLHYEASAHDDAVLKEWKTLHIPANVKRWVKLYHYLIVNDIYHFSPGNDEVGVVIGVGDTLEKAMEHLNKNIELMKDLPLHANVSGFEDLLESIEKAEKQGIKFYSSKETASKKPDVKKEVSAYDFDGVVSEGVMPKKEDMIITGRTKDLAPETKKIMKELGVPDVPVHYYPRMDLDNNKKIRDTQIAEHKVKVINDRGVTKFTEDTPLQAEIVRKKTDAKVTLFKK